MKPYAFPGRPLVMHLCFLDLQTTKGTPLYREEGVQKKDSARIKLENPTEFFRAAQKRGGWSLRQDRIRATRRRP